VWVKNLAHGDPIQITFGDVPASRPRWSPKNDAIVFSRRGQGIWSAPPLGGPARRLIAEGRNPNFSADGEHLVFEKGRAIWMAKADGSQQRLVYSIPHTYYGMDTHPALSPDGRAIVFFLAEIGPNGDFWVISVAGGHPRRLTHDTREGVTPVWTPDGRSIVFSSTRRGSRTLWRIPAQGGLPEPLTTGAGEDRDPAISPDGKTMVYSNVRNSWAILFLDPASGAQTEVLDQRTGVKFPMFAPDGQTIAFFAQDARGDAHIFAVRTDGRELRQVTRGEGLMNTMPRWAPDGRVLYYYRVFPERSFRRVAVTGEGDTQLFGWAWETSQGANIDPQGERIVYELQNASGAGPATIIHDIASGREQVLADGRGHLNGPRWSRDGQFIAGARDDGKVVVCPAIGGECRALATGDNPAWSGDGSGLYFLRPTGSPATRELWFIGVDGHNEKKVGLLGPFFVIDVHFDVSRQDRIVWTQYREGRQELWLAKLP
jgi:Tol biopolymer transport system component